MSKKSYTEGATLTKEQLVLYPSEQLAPLKKKAEKLFIGIPKEKSKSENRVSLRPEAVEILVRNGHEIRVETGAGLGAKFTDQQYSEAGAEVCYSTKEVFEGDIILKIEPPTLEEIEYMRFGRTIVSSLPMARMDTSYIKALMQKKCIGIAYQFIQNKVGEMPIIRSMSEIAGSTVMLIASEYLSSAHEGKGIILGGITGVPPTKVVIIGAGTVGEYAARTAIGLGAETKIFDKDIYKLRRIKYAVGHQMYTSTIDAGILAEAVSRADVVIGAMRAEKGLAPCVVTEEMVQNMKPNSVIIDVSIDQGGVFETSEVTTHENPTFKKYEVVHYCVPNIASRVSRTSSTALSNIFTPYLMKISQAGGIDEMIFANKWFMDGVYTYKGSLTNQYLANKFDMPYKDLGLLMAARL